MVISRWGALLDIKNQTQVVVRRMRTDFVDEVREPKAFIMSKETYTYPNKNEYYFSYAWVSYGIVRTHTHLSLYVMCEEKE